MSRCVSAVVFAKDAARVAAFYVNVLGLKLKKSDADHALLDAESLQLIVHQIPRFIASGIDIAQPPQRREATAVRLNFTTVNMDECRDTAAAYGGMIDAAPPPWASSDATIRLGHDPEGNVFGLDTENDLQIDL